MKFIKFLNKSSFKNNKHFSSLIRIDYNDVMSEKNSDKLNEIVDKAYSINSLGAIVVTNIPDLKNIKDKVLNNGLKMIKMTQKEKEFSTEEKNKLFLGWKESKVIWNDKEDKYIGEFCARANRDTIYYPQDKSLEEKYRNIWPNHIPNFKEDYVNLGLTLGKIQSSMLNHIDYYLKTKYNLNNDIFGKIIKLHDLFGQLICYKPPKKIINEWIALHRDNGILTALVHPNYYNIEENKKIDGIACSLQIKDRLGNFHMANYNDNELVLQIGEMMMLFSAGYISATPHRVIVNEENKNYLRVNYAQVFDPTFSQMIYLPNNTTIDDIIDRDSFKGDFKLENFHIGKSYKEYITIIEEHQTKY